MTEDTNRILIRIQTIKKQVKKLEKDCEQSVGTLANEVGLNRNLSDSQYQFLLTQMADLNTRLAKRIDMLNFCVCALLLVSMGLVGLWILRML